MSAIAEFLDSGVGLVTSLTVLAGVLIGAFRWVYYVGRKVHDIYAQLAPGDGDSLAQQIHQLSDIMKIEVAARRFYWAYDKEALFECDPSGECIWVNKRICELFGLEGQEMMGNGWLSAVAHEDRERTWDLWHSAVQARVPYEAQYRLRHPQSRVESDVRAVVTCCYIDGKQARFFGVVKPVNQQGPKAVA